MITPTNQTSPTELARATTPAGRYGFAARLALLSVLLAAGFIVDAMLGLAIPALAYDAPPVWWDAVLRAVLHLGQLAAAVAVSRAQLAGSGTTARIGISLWIFGSVCYVAGELLYILARGPSDIAFEVGSFAMLIGMVLAGIGVLRTGRWTGPGRFLALITGLYIIPFTVAIMATDAALIALTGYSVLWLLLGLSLYSVTRAQSAALARR